MDPLNEPEVNIKVIIIQPVALPDIRKIHHVKSYLWKIKEKIKHIITSFTLHDRWTGPEMYRMKMKIISLQ